MLRIAILAIDLQILPYPFDTNNLMRICFLQVGLFFYDIFWVFFTPVMVSVAKSFDAPIKVYIEYKVYKMIHHVKGCK